MLLLAVTYCHPHSLDATRTSRKAAKSSRSFALRLQRVDGRRFDALVADILCSRVHGVAAPTVSYVSAPLVRRASVHLLQCVCVCALLPVRVGVLVGVPDFVCFVSLCTTPICLGVFICVCRYPITAFFEGIDFVLMEKSFVILKVMSNID